MSLAGHEPKSGSRHGFLIIASTWLRDPVLYLLVYDHAPTRGAQFVRCLSLRKDFFKVILFFSNLVWLVCNQLLQTRLSSRIRLSDAFLRESDLFLTLAEYWFLILVSEDQSYCLFLIFAKTQANLCRDDSVIGSKSFNGIFWQVLQKPVVYFDGQWCTCLCTDRHKKFRKLHKKAVVRKK